MELKMSNIVLQCNQVEIFTTDFSDNSLYTKAHTGEKIQVVIDSRIGAEPSEEYSSISNMSMIHAYFQGRYEIVYSTVDNGYNEMKNTMKHNTSVLSDDLNFYKNGILNGIGVLDSDTKHDYSMNETNRLLLSSAISTKLSAYQTVVALSSNIMSHDLFNYSSNCFLIHSEHLKTLSDTEQAYRRVGQLFSNTTHNYDSTYTILESNIKLHNISSELYSQLEQKHDIVSTDLSTFFVTKFGEQSALSTKVESLIHSKETQYEFVNQTDLSHLLHHWNDESNFLDSDTTQLSQAQTAIHFNMSTILRSTIEHIHNEYSTYTYTIETYENKMREPILNAMSANNSTLTYKLQQKLNVEGGMINGNLHVHNMIYLGAYWRIRDSGSQLFFEYYDSQEYTWKIANPFFQM